MPPPRHSRDIYLGVPVRTLADWAVEPREAISALICSLQVGLAEADLADIARLLALSALDALQEAEGAKSADTFARVLLRIFRAEQPREL